ncbi:MAG: VTT domain-containing protein [Chitinophagaceae bacterium]|nr:VTT domain-containing protein [Chitinophagaceae bacterium]
MRSLIFSLIGLLLLNGTFAQQQVKIKVINQYEAPVDDFEVDGVKYKTSKDGSAIIAVNAVDSAGFSGAEYPATKIAVSEIKEGATITIQKKFTWKDIVNPMFYIKYGGLWLLLFIIFAETGLFVGFFLPGDSLLFVAGIYSSNLAHEFLNLFGIKNFQNEWVELFILCALISVAGILGNLAGYWTGRKVGPAMFKWKDNLLFRKKYLHDAHEFYEQHGGGAIIMARFLPIVRTFAPIVAGIVQMDKKKFIFFNVVGSIAWVITMIFAGHFLQIWVKNQFGIELKDKLELIVIIIIAVTTAPVLWKFFFSKQKDRTPKAD